MTDDMAAIAERARQAWNRGNRDNYLELYDPRIAMHGAAQGLAEVRRYYEGIWRAFPDAQLTYDDMLAERDRLVIRFRMTGTHAGELMGIPPTGKAITLSGITIMRFANGKVVERWSQSDFLGLLQQLGVA
jgi:steroid delta-isomerase-like uncharacterized protein